MQQHNIWRKVCLAVAVLGASVTAASPVMAAYPDKPVRFIVPFPPAVATDILARILAQKLTDVSGQPFVVENRAGAGGNVGMESFLR